MDGHRRFFGRATKIQDIYDKTTCSASTRAEEEFNLELFAEIGLPVTGTSAPMTPGGPPDIEQLVAITQKYGVELLPRAEHAG